MANRYTNCIWKVVVYIQTFAADPLPFMLVIGLMNRLCPSSRIQVTPWKFHWHIWYRLSYESISESQTELLLTPWTCVSIITTKSSLCPFPSCNLPLDRHLFKLVQRFIRKIVKDSYFPISNILQNFWNWSDSYPAVDCDRLMKVIRTRLMIVRMNGFVIFTQKILCGLGLHLV